MFGLKVRSRPNCVFIPGLMVGAIIRYASDEKETSHLLVMPVGNDSNQSMPSSPPDNVFIQLEVQRPPDASKVSRMHQ